MSTEPTKVYVGDKSVITYVMNATGALQREGRVIVAARGNLISKAILVAYRLVKDTPFTVKTTASVEQRESNDKKIRDVPVISLEITVPTEI